MDWIEINIPFIIDSNFDSNNLHSEEFLKAYREAKFKFPDEEFENFFKSPEYIRFCIELEKYNKELPNRSFFGRGLAKPGTLMECLIHDNIQIVLIGHVNIFGNSDESTEYPSFLKNAVVLRYKIIWE